MSIEFRQRPETYLGEARYAKPKRVFSLLGDLLEQAGSVRPGASFLDMGCATGELIYYLQGRFPDIAFTGVDNQPELLARARAHEALRGATFVEADALAYAGGPFDHVACFGMMGIFDTFEPLLENLVANTKKGGRIFIHGLINDVDIDVRLYYRDHHNRKDWNSGFNIFSMNRLAQWLEPRVASWRLTPVELDVDIERRPDSPHRAYTVKLEGGQRVTTNGLCLLLPEKVLEIVV